MQPSMTEALNEEKRVEEAQLPSYLRLTRFRMGLLINFHVPMLKNERPKIVNEFSASAISACSTLLGQ